MNFLSLISVEFKKIKRSKILILLAASLIILWTPSVLNARLNFHMEDVGISPEHNFMIQGFMGMAWFIYPAVMIVCTVLLWQTERGSRGLLKMLSLPLDPRALCLAKFLVLLALTAVHMILMAAAYYISAAAASWFCDYNFLVKPSLALGLTGKIWLASIPMAAVFWMLSALIRTPVFSIGIGLASLVPSVLILNTRAWFLYPACYPFHVVTEEYGRLGDNFGSSGTDPLPWLAAAAVITIVCLGVSCLCFGRQETR